MQEIQLSFNDFQGVPLKNENASKFEFCIRKEPLDAIHRTLPICIFPRKITQFN
jgi:hypothetical protein